jgi:CheY-like chemotaxis protein
MIYSGLLVSQMTSQSPLRRHADQINLAAERGRQLIGQLLDFSRRHPAESKVISLSDLVEGMREMLQRLLGEHIDLSVRCRPGIGAVHADPAQIEQVIMNLALNGRDAMPEGGKLRIETAEVQVDESHARTRLGLAAGSYVRLSVSDSGHGMDAATRSHAFEPFFSTKERGRGTGLGLSTVYGIVRQNGGHVEIDSQLGKGTTVSILLPRVGDSAEHGPRRRREREFSGSETVLLVEDEELVRRSIHDMLTHKGYHVLQARHGREAMLIEQRYPGPIDLMVTDLVMPDINGRELAERLQGSRPEMRVLFISGYGDDPRLLQLGEQGKAFFRKPFTPAALSQKVREVLAAAPAVSA